MLGPLLGNSEKLSLFVEGAINPSENGAISTKTKMTQIALAAFACVTLATAYQEACGKDYGVFSSSNQAFIAVCLGVFFSSR